MLVELHAGEGGGDAADWMHELAGVYARHAALAGLEAELLAADGPVVIRVAGPGAARAFAGEVGGHVVQRVPAGDRRGKRQTSVVAVMVLPLPPEGGGKAPPLPAGELDVTFQPKGGPGGQHRNKTASACRMVHRPTGLAVFIDGRQQHQNRELAHRILSQRVADRRAEAARRGYAGVREAQWTGAGRGAKVRTYNFIRNTVVDHATGRQTGDLKAVMKGHIELLR